MQGVTIKLLTKHGDARGWVAEIFRSDEAAYCPAMAYISQTECLVTRGPHEHAEQTDCFVFLGVFRLDLWDNRAGSPTHGQHEVHTVGSVPTLVVVPPGVVHAYRNTDIRPGLVLNLPDRLYAGAGRTEPVDEIRHEDNPASTFCVHDEWRRELAANTEAY